MQNPELGRCGHCTLPRKAARATGARLRYCTGCYAVRYCGKACQHAAWPAHRATCRNHQADRTCPVCLDAQILDKGAALAANAVSCPNGHAVCGQCWRAMLGMDCPVCRAAYNVVDVLRQMVTQPQRQGRSQLVH